MQRFHFLVGREPEFGSINAGGRIVLDVALGEPHRAHLQADHFHMLAGFGANQLGRAAADIDDQELGRGVELQAALNRQITQLGLGLTGDHFQIETGELLDLCDKGGAVGYVAKGGGSRRRRYDRRRVRGPCRLISTIASSVRLAESGSSLPLASTPRPRRVIRRKLGDVVEVGR